MSLMCNLQADKTLILAFFLRSTEIGFASFRLFSQFTRTAMVKPQKIQVANPISVLVGLILAIQAVLLRVRSEKT